MVTLELVAVGHMLRRREVAFLCRLDWVLASFLIAVLRLQKLVVNGDCVLPTAVDIVDDGGASAQRQMTSL